MPCHPPSYNKSGTLAPCLSTFRHVPNSRPQERFSAPSSSFHQRGTNAGTKLKNTTKDSKPQWNRGLGIFYVVYLDLRDIRTSRRIGWTHRKLSSLNRAAVCRGAVAMLINFLLLTMGNTIQPLCGVSPTDLRKRNHPKHLPQTEQQLPSSRPDSVLQSGRRCECYVRARDSAVSRSHSGVIKEYGRTW
jgi:hypothetical protein